MSLAIGKLQVSSHERQRWEPVPRCVPFEEISATFAAVAGTASPDQVIA
jgi:hypothetical protein